MNDVSAFSPSDVRRFLSVLHASGDTFEVRIPKYGKYNFTASGYFDDIDTAVDALCRWDGQANAFVTLNPVNPALLSRARNRIVERANATTSDADIARRAWLFVDIDPMRPSGISSTDDELAAAEALAAAVEAFLADLGWPTPVVAMSGNGAYLLYRVDLSNDPTSLALISRVHLYYTTTRAAANASAIADALTVIEARALFDADERRVWLRVGEGPDGEVYIDLGGPEWRVIRVTSDGWTLSDGVPLHFRRSPLTAPMPRPVTGGSIDLLRPFLTTADDDAFVRLAGWLLGALRPCGPYSVLAFVAEQGSGKSFTGTLLRSLVDPSSVPLRGTPRTERDLVIAAQHNRVLAFDNISTLPQWLSDAFCRLATGAGYATRSLFTNRDEEVFAESRPTLLTGIEDFIVSGDLLDRSSLVELRAIPESRREQERVLWERFHAVQPLILGALLDAVAMSLRDQPTTVLPGLPRMADYAAWVTAGESSFGWSPGTFLSAFASGTRDDVVLDSSLIVGPLRTCLGAWGDAGWQGTATDLLSAIEKHASDATQRKKTWPKSPSALSGHLRRLAPNLRADGIDVTFDKDTGTMRRRVITIRPTSPEDRRPRRPVRPGEADATDDEGSHRPFADDIDGGHQAKPGAASAQVESESDAPDSADGDSRLLSASSWDGVPTVTAVPALTTGGEDFEEDLI